MPIRDPLPRSTPEAVGIPSSALEALVDALDRQIQEPHSVMVVRRGSVVAEGWWHPYAPERPHLLFSLTKSFTSTAIGLAQAQGLLSLDDPVVKFFPAEAPRPGRHLRALTVRHLLTMSTGRLTDSSDDVFGDPQGDWHRGFFRRPWLRAPGSPFVYDTGASQMLGAIVSRVTGRDLRDYLDEHLFGPLGIDRPAWEAGPRGQRTGGYGLSLRTEDIAKFGQLLLDGGRWRGRALVPEAWVAEATRKQVANDLWVPSGNPDWRQGYGYQFWRGQHGSFRGDGAFGQYCLVLPTQQTVVAATSAVANMQDILDLVWKHLWPALGQTALAPDEAAHKSLTVRTGALRLPLPTGERTSPTEPTLSKQQWVFEHHRFGPRSLTLEFDPEGLTLAWISKQGSGQVRAGRGGWAEGVGALFPPPEHFDTLSRAASLASFAWTGPTTLRLVVRLIEGPFVQTWDFHFEEGCLWLEGRINVDFGVQPPLRLVAAGRRRR